MTTDRDALIEAMARAEHDAGEAEWSWERLVIEEPAWAEGWRANATAALPVAVRAILAPLRELHRSQRTSARLPQGQGVVIEWTYCAGCSRAVTPPCPTARLIDAIEADLIGDAK